ncbi:CGNR zinc finger domain-containing protein [Actinoplanes sp. HUAS TT8]|uniref:CGNR zinc finger domain-containing protein n=1 Tax=Actinoplanes sp. HUAS TT8 TaxID=3447453 RepID=UPI003F51B20C
MATTDEDLLLALLNTTPVIDGVPRDDLIGPDWLVTHGQPGTQDEWRALVDVRSVLRDLVREKGDVTTLAPFLDGVTRRPALGAEGIEWTLDLPPGRSAAARAVLAWDGLRVDSPGRLRACANAECRLFLIDRSKSNSARWCSMAVCGNRMKARRHYGRSRPATPA